MRSFDYNLIDYASAAHSQMRIWRSLGLCYAARLACARDEGFWPSLRSCDVVDPCGQQYCVPQALAVDGNRLRYSAPYQRTEFGTSAPRMHRRSNSRKTGGVRAPKYIDIIL
jgi:hypothetical protein